MMGVGYRIESFEISYRACFGPPSPGIPRGLVSLTRRTLF